MKTISWCEVYFQRANEYSLAGSIHKGRVTRVLPGMQSAFVDLGLERDTFLYVSDFLEEHDDIDRVTGDEPPAPRERERERASAPRAPPQPPRMRSRPAPAEAPAPEGMHPLNPPAEIAAPSGDRPPRSDDRPRSATARVPTIAVATTVADDDRSRRRNRGGADSRIRSMRPEGTPPRSSRATVESQPQAIAPETEEAAAVKNPFR